MSHLTLPLLSVPDVVVLPGMVVPIELDDDVRAVIDAAQAAAPRARTAGCCSRRGWPTATRPTA